MRDHIDRALEKLRPHVFSEPGCQAAFKLQLQLADSAWFAPEQIEQEQLTNLKQLAAFATRESPFWAARLNAGTLQQQECLADALSQIPILSRADVVDNPDALRAAALPAGQIAMGEVRTSGSTGALVSIQTTNVAITAHHALTVRGHLWAGRDFSRPMAVVRRYPRGVAEHPKGYEDVHWGNASNYPFSTGPAFHLNTHNASLDEIREWLTRIKAPYLITYPSILRDLAQMESCEKYTALPLEGITTIGEVVDRDLRRTIAETFRSRIDDLYSSQEVGTIAIQCPDSDAYHIQSEMVIVEILDEYNHGCLPGQTGRVVVTPLFNYATPLFRYELGDFAEAGSQCTCGRTLPTLNRIAGRRRNLLTLPDGRRFWPPSGALRMQKIALIRQHQYRQTARDTIDVLLVTDQPLTPEQEAELRRVVANGLPGNLNIRICRVSEIPRPPGGKYEEFLSLVG